MKKKIVVALSLCCAAFGANCNSGDADAPQESMLLLAALVGSQGN